MRLFVLHPVCGWQTFDLITVVDAQKKTLHGVRINAQGEKVGEEPKVVDCRAEENGNYFITVHEPVPDGKRERDREKVED